MIYALSDAALVVSSAAENGGTWAGAVEALDAGRITIYVKANGSVKEGNRKLLARGGRPFPEGPWDGFAIAVCAGRTRTDAVHGGAYARTDRGLDGFRGTARTAKGGARRISYAGIAAPRRLRCGFARPAAGLVGARYREEP